MNDLPAFDESVLWPLLDQITDGVAVAAPRPWRLLYANSTLAKWFGKTTDELRGSPLEKLFTSDTCARLLELAKTVGEGTSAHGEMKVAAELNGVRHGLLDVRLYRLKAGKQPMLGLILRRAPQRPHAELPTAERIDPLTGLPDRQFLFTRLASLLQGERSSDSQFAVLFVDLDNFKQVNDEYGHLMGDRVLREVARRLMGCLREGDVVVRFGGDEFVVLLERVAGQHDIEPVVRRIHTALARPIALPEGEFTLSLSVGIAQRSPDHHSPEDLLRDADRAMYAAKRRRD
ncbi:MAG: diguanylate cyclase [Pirellulales bacterium]